MHYLPEQATIVLNAARKVLQSSEADDVKLKNLWTTLVYLRGAGLTRGLQIRLGDRVYGGPFQGMQMTPAVLNTNLAPHLLGCYEQELHETIERIIAAPYRHIVNIGCSYGYYSVGLARRMPNATVHAFDIEETEREKCREMAVLNGVAARIEIGGAFRGEDFARYGDGKTLVIVDIEGAERELLDPALYPALRDMDILVELHDCIDKAISETVTGRFAATHDIELIRNRSFLYPFEEILGPARYVDPFDKLIFTWEMREGPTPWAIMRVKSF